MQLDSRQKIFVIIHSVIYKAIVQVFGYPFGLVIVI